MYAIMTIVLFAAIDETVKLVEGVGGKCYGYRCDLADKEDVYKMAKKTREEAGDVSSRKRYRNVP